MELYAKNPFRVLGLAPTSTLRDISRRSSEFEAFQLVGQLPSYPYDFPWVGALDRSLDAIREAAQRVEDPISRLEESVFWIEAASLQSLESWASKTPEQLMPELYGRVHNQVESESLEVPRVAHVLNRAILSHALLLHADGTRPAKDARPDEHWHAWKETLDQWQKLVKRKTFIRFLEQRAKAWKDPRLSDAAIAAVPERVMARLSRCQVELCKKLDSAGRKAALKRHLAILRDTGFQSADANDELLQSRIDAIRRACDKADQSLKELKKELPAAKATRECLTIQKALSATCVPLITELSQLDAGTSSHWIKDRYADTLRSIAVRITNQGNDPGGAMKLVDAALSRATSSALKHKLQNDKRQLEENLIYAGSTPITSAPELFSFYGCGVRMYGRRNADPKTGIYRTIYYFTLLFIPVFPISAYWVRDLGDRTQFFMKAPVDKGDQIHRWVSGAIGALFLLMYSLSPSTPSARTPSTSTSGQYTSRSALKSDLAERKKELEDLWPKIEKEGESLKKIGDAITKLQGEKDAIEAVYTSETIPLDTLETYNEIIENLKRLIPEHNSKAKKAKKLVDDYKVKEDEYNDLVKKYNRGR